jgi:hypothetical protein
MRAALEAARFFNESILSGSYTMRSMLAAIHMPLLACLTTTLALSGAAHAQTTISAPTGTKSLAATLNVYAFPGAGQVATQQAQDETECYNWAVNETGSDPFHIAKQAEQQQQQAAQQQQQAEQSKSGSAVKGAVAGAAGGALIGAIAGNAGKGAAIGAGVGAIGNRARATSQANQASQQAQQTQ